MVEEHHEHHETHSEAHHEAHHHEKGFKISKTLIFQITTAILAIALVAVLVIGGIPGVGMGADKTTVANNVVTYLNDNFQTTAKLISVEEKGGIYNLTLEIQGQNTSVYTTADGKLVFPIAIDTTEKQATTASASGTTPPSTTVTKSEKPVVQLFVMSQCPFGTQIEKGIIPVVELLGSKIDFTLKFVDYVMHGKTEVDEQLNQYCIETQFNSKYLDYLKCFLEDGNTSRCVANVSIDKTALASCIATADTQYNVTNLFNDKSSWVSGQFPQFNVYKAENEQYQVQGSPTLVINDAEAQSGRDPASLLKLICSAFETPPAECDQQLSSTSPSSGFGYEITGSATAATCG